MASTISWNRQAEEHQISWRTRHPLASNEWGWQNGVQREHILPSDQWHLGLWQPIRESVAEYIRVSDIQPNQGKHNLKSSWTQCISMFYPIRWDKDFRDVFAGFLSTQWGMDVTAIEEVEFEYSAPGKLNPDRLLGEHGGKRGSMQTSPDVVLQFNYGREKSGLYLIENKYTEHFFYDCSGAKKTLDKNYSERGLPPNEHPERCRNVVELYQNSDKLCQQQSWGRKYWSLLKTTINLAMLRECGQCPAMTDGYQLFRQQALAQGIADSKVFDVVISGVAYDNRNHKLGSCLESIHIKDFHKRWHELFKDGVDLSCFEHQQYVQYVKEHIQSKKMEKWAKYVSERYEY